MTDSARHPDRPTADWLKDRIAAAIAEAAIDVNEAGSATLYSELHRADGYLNDLHALAKQGEAYEKALTYARSLYRACLCADESDCYQRSVVAGQPCGRSLYRDGQQPTSAELAETVRFGLLKLQAWLRPGTMAWSRDGLDALSELVIRAAGHVPSEAFAAAMTALEAAEAEVREVRAREQRTSTEGAKRAKAQRERAEQAEKERDEAVYDLSAEASRGDAFEAERDRLAAALERLAHPVGEPKTEEAALYAMEVEQIAREALNPGDGA